MEEVGPNIWDLHCLDCVWQDWTWAGQASAEEITDRHSEAMKTVGRHSINEAVKRGVAMRDIYGMLASRPGDLLRAN